MAKNYRQLTESVKERINPENFSLKKTFSDELSTISYNEVLTYIRVSMKGVEPEYTQKSKDAGEKVKEHISNEIKDITFKYQGSVMTDTHIKGYSDIDLLVICEKFYQPDNYNIKKILENSEQRVKFFSSLPKLEKEVNGTTYQGNEIEDLKKIRIDSENILSKVYLNCDKTKPKAIKIKNLNLNREVDIVVANWYDDVSSVINDKGDHRGIQIYNKGTNSRENSDYPFLSIKRINERSSATNGRLKKMIRFLKNNKANSEQEIDLSSFDINAICYDINIADYQFLSFYELVPVIYNQMKKIASDDNKADNLISVDGREYIFRNQSSKKENLKKLLAEVESIFLDLKNTFNL
jgi:predicted nucleotidyltransferase